jgi:hypothetical protein
MISGIDNRIITQKDFIINIKDTLYRSLELKVSSNINNIEYQFNISINNEINISINNIDDYNFFYKIESFILNKLFEYLLENKYINNDIYIYYQYYMDNKSNIYNIKTYYNNLGFDIDDNNVILNIKGNIDKILINIKENIKENINKKIYDDIKFEFSPSNIRTISLYIPFPLNYPSTEFKQKYKHMHIAILDCNINLIDKNLYIEKFYVNSNRMTNISDNEKKITKNLGKNLLCYLVSYILKNKYLSEDDNVKLLAVSPISCDKNKLEKYKDITDNDINSFFNKFPDAINKYKYIYIDNPDNYIMTRNDYINIICKYNESQKKLEKYYNKYGFIISEKDYIYKNSYETPMVSKIKYINNYCNIDNICTLYDLNYLKYLSEEDNLFIKKIVNNYKNNIKNKQLTYLLNNYYNPKPYEKVNYIYNLRTIINMTYEDKMNIYLFGDIHSNKKSCNNYTPNADVAYFLDQQIKTSTKQLDIYLEDELITKKYYNDINKEHYTTIDPISTFTKEYLGCLTADKTNCKYPHIRVHSIDLRKTKIQNENNIIIELSFMFFYLYSIFTTYENVNNDILYIIKSTIDNIKIILYNNVDVFKNKNVLYDNIINNISYKIKKQQLYINNSLLNNIINYANEKWVNNILDIKFNIINYESVMKWIDEYTLYINSIDNNGKIITDYFYKQFNILNIAFLDISSYYMDLYLILRLFRTYIKSTEYKYSDQAKNIIIYAGAWHINRYKDILYELSCVIKYESKTKYDNYGCVNISDLKQPLFKDKI